ncbi:hypothetical protein DFP74_4140 [Nocardiopsis sp. Huas11]|uniref:hypothetical protein n=1 Tax=Nocardiopsis sp. Huas11 TaxID=2183912 RepID=UPI000EB0359C|nr:hypothetical protein [Nocardiopsis sp. Huas11]RKS08442.1 hypothetical protein DFP74_4140 [Nocardiopsis sp. Huas11]
MARSHPSDPPATLPRVLGVLWAQYARRPGTLLVTASVPMLLGWFVVLRVRLLTLDDARWIEGRLVYGSWLDEPIASVLWTVMGGVGLPLAYALTAVLIGGRLLGHPVRLRSALALVLRRWPLLLGWWSLVLFGVVLVVGAFSFAASLPEELPSIGPIGLVEMLQGLVFVVVLPALLASWMVLVPVALLEEISGRDALERAWELGAERRIPFLLCSVLVLALLALPETAAALVSGTRGEATDGIVLGLAVQGLVLALLAPLAVLTACAPALWPRGGGDSLRLTPTLRASSVRETRPRRRVVLATTALAVLVALPLGGAQAMGERLDRVPRVSIARAMTPIGWDVLPDGSGYAGVEITLEEDESAEFHLVTCAFDCSEGPERRGVGDVPEGVVPVAAAAVPLEGDMLVAMASVPEDLIPERSEPGGPRLSDEELTFAATLDLYRCSDTSCAGPRTLDLPDPPSVTGRENHTSGDVRLFAYRMRLAATQDGAFAAVLYTDTLREDDLGDDQYTALVACPDPDCGDPAARVLEGADSPRLVLAPDASPVITHRSPETDATHLLVCGDPTCAERRTHHLDGPSSLHPQISGRLPTPDVAVGPSGRAHVASVDTDGERYLYRSCTDVDCTAVEAVTLMVNDDVPGILRSEGGMYLDAEERPRVLVSGRLVSCADPFCGL